MGRVLVHRNPLARRPSIAAPTSGPTVGCTHLAPRTAAWTSGLMNSAPHVKECQGMRCTMRVMTWRALSISPYWDVWSLKRGGEEGGDRASLR